MAKTTVPIELSSTPGIVDNSNATAITIDSSENVGIGTSNPSHLLTMHGDTARLTIRDTSAYSADTGPLIALQGIDSNDNPQDFAQLKGHSVTSANGEFSISTRASGTNQERVRVTYDGNVGIGTDSPSHELQVQDSSSNGTIRIGGGSGLDIEHDNSGTTMATIKQLYATTSASAQLRFMGGFTTFHTGTSNTERMRIDSSGNLKLGTSAANTYRLTVNSANTTEGSGGPNAIFQNSDGSVASLYVFNTSATGTSTAGSALWVQKNSSTSRSINAAGTVNASGADYAEYMKKSSSCGTIAKGDVCGVDSSGELTDVYADAVSFVVKSTNPSYVGGDTWGADDLNLSEEELETERQKYDRIAFSGQVPVNITGTFNVGDYVYPQANGSAIECVAKSSPTFEEYQKCVGKVWAIEDDGRPRIAVKIG